MEDVDLLIYERAWSFVYGLANRKGIKMRASKIICFAVGAMLAATAARADEISIVSNILGPEGPLYVDGNLYYVGCGPVNRPPSRASSACFGEFAPPDKKEMQSRRRPRSVARPH